MATLDVSVGGRSYQLACEDGQEKRLAELARVVDAELRALAAQIGAVGEARLLLMAALVLADRLSDAETAAAPEDFSGIDAATARLERLVADAGA
ncbi:cell division protein ZapA [Rubrimonas cliftonensis]|uniref:Cell division protein ZapA n=1 Tax=Rubrimonas cliftonensis TaxID=89524 RepID=A0A1H3YZL0_9RHOB|nr:cell division protein ZapA [Rubrimonas cliftonensis]SEA16494.1 cell division protein ZapA [Rubrimonas cliftonensis]